MSTRDRPSVLIIGSGFGGIGAAIELTRHGYRDVIVLERADRLGGVWRENTYPGAACDVPSPLYSYSYEPNPNWSKRYSPQPEILAYLQATAAKYGVDQLIRYGVEVTSADYDEASARWRVHTTSGEVFEADALVPALGQLSRPIWPDIPGQDAFAGRSFHSATWAHDVDLAGRRVAVIGTGASAIQFVPQIQPEVGELTLFQRTAPWILPQPQKRYARHHHWLFRRLPVFQRFERLAIWLLLEVLQKAMIRPSKVMLPLASRLAKLRLRYRVRDAGTRAALTPNYPAGCKRVLFSNVYVNAVIEANVSIVTDAITAIEADGVRTADGVLHHVDVIVYGTGFAATDFLAPLRITGADGVELGDVWAKGAHAYLGMTVPRFPNLFLMYGPNTNLGSGSIIAMLERQARYVRQALDLIADTGGSSLDVRPEVEAAFDEQTQARLVDSVWTHCRSWYRMPSGRVPTNWPGTVTEYDRRTRHLNPGDYHLEGVPTGSVTSARG